MDDPKHAAMAHYLAQFAGEDAPPPPPTPPHVLTLGFKAAMVERLQGRVRTQKKVEADDNEALDKAGGA